MNDPYGPSTRTDSKQPHPNVIRRFREELRLDRKEFSELIDVNIDTLRVWESSRGTRPRGEAALVLISFANKNDYPLTIEDIYPPLPKKKRKPNGK
jgi:DNA-binding transcriptional regulator YiaG